MKMTPLPIARGEDLQAICRLRNSVDTVGWSPRLRGWFGYHTPDEVYEAILHRLVCQETVWLDLGCGRHVFPSNERLSWLLAKRCRVLVGADPSENIHHNPFVHRKSQSSIESLSTDERFTLVTMRMVAEHVTNPSETVQALSEKVASGGFVVILTVNKWAPLAVLASLVPFKAHHALKYFVWRTEERDTFPTIYRMNTRRTLSGLMTRAGFAEEYCDFLPDCTCLARWRIASVCELAVWKVLKAIGIQYPETCLLGIYRKL
jgi:2-polyprenyl-3-methyl-5-hydroxy-6-metoxy-1,4-benzoquinol methylase